MSVISPEDTLKKYEAALNSHNEKNLDSLVDPEAVFIFTEGTFKGIEEIKSACVKTWAYFENEVYAINNLEWLYKTDSSASCIYLINWSADLDGERQSFQGRGTTLLKNTPNGWRIIHEHLSRAPE